MTWKLDGKPIAYDYDGFSAPSDLWDVLVEHYGSRKAALLSLIKDSMGYIHVDVIVGLLADIHADPEKADGTEIQSLIDELIWDTAILPSDETMMERTEDDPLDNAVTLAGLTFVWYNE